MRPRSIVVLAAATFLLLVIHVPVQAGTRSRVLLGAYSQDSIEAFEALIGRSVAINHRFYSWHDQFPNESERADVEAGRTPMVTWEPWGTDLDAIIAGKYDALIRACAQEAAAFGETFFLRWGHEMNGNWYPWSGK